MSHCPKFMVVTFPGKVVNSDKALQCIGGLGRVAIDYYKNRGPELKFQVANPYEAPAFSHPKKFEMGTYLVVRTRRKKIKNVPEGEVVPPICDEEIKVDFLGVVSKIYEFDGMCDFQFLPAQKSANDKWDNLIPKLYPQDIPSALNWFEEESSFSHPAPLFATPHFFSRYQYPSKELMCRETAYQLLKDADRKCADDVIGANTRNERKNLSLNVNHEQEFPKEPPQYAVDDSDARCPISTPHERMRQIFEQRPLWTRNAIISKTELDVNVVKTLLQKYAFYIMNGPFGRLWCKFGYNPKECPDARRYQTLQLVLGAKHSRIIADGCRSSRRSSGPSRISHIDESIPDKTVKGVSVHDWVFESGHVPHARQIWYQMCDIKLDIVQDELAIDCSNPCKPCDPSTGYFSIEFLDAVREAIKNDVHNSMLKQNVQKDSQMRVEEELGDD